MDYTRRDLLRAGLLSSIAATAGCQDGRLNDPGFQRETATASHQLGETAEFTNESGYDLTLTITDARLEEALFYTAYSSVSAETAPEEDGAVLLAQYTIESTGDRTVRHPTRTTVAVDGTEHEILSESYPSGRSDIGAEVAPGSSDSDWLIAKVPTRSGEAAIETTIDTFPKTKTIRWTFDLGSLDYEPYDHTGLALGESLTVGHPDRQYSISVTDVQQVDSYTYDGETEQPDEGHTFVRVGLEATNTGEQAVDIPDDVSLVADTTYEADGYIAAESERFDRVQLSPGVATDGIVFVEIPEDVEPTAIQVAVAHDNPEDLVATWSV